MQKKTVVAIAVIVSVLTGYNPGPNRGTTEGAANESPPTGVILSPHGSIIIGTGSISDTASDNGCGEKGRAWLDKKTGDYCVEKDYSINFLNGHKIMGPASGNYYEDLKKATDSK